MKKTSCLMTRGKKEIQDPDITRDMYLIRAIANLSFSHSALTPSPRDFAVGSLKRR